MWIPGTELESLGLAVGALPTKPHRQHPISQFLSLYFYKMSLLTDTLNTCVSVRFT